MRIVNFSTLSRQIESCCSSTLLFREAYLETPSTVSNASHSLHFRRQHPHNKGQLLYDTIHSISYLETMDVVSSTNQPCRSSTETWTKTKLSSGFSHTLMRSKIDHCKKGRATKRKVWFGPCTVHEYTLGPADDLSIEEFRDLWWSREEFDLIMITARIAANEARHHPIVSGGLDQAFQLAIRTGTQFSQKDQLHEHLQQLQVEERGLKLWCQYDRSRRGLEKYTSRQYNIVRRKQREDLNKRVLSLSRQGADPEEICMVAERTSRLSVVFARMLAIADHTSTRDGISGSNEAVGKSLERPSVVKTRPELTAQGFTSSRFQ